MLQTTVPSCAGGYAITQMIWKQLISFSMAYQVSCLSVQESRNYYMRSRDNNVINPFFLKEYRKNYDLKVKLNNYIFCRILTMVY
jgi:hypothetical protein